MFTLCHSNPPCAKRHCANESFDKNNDQGLLSKLPFLNRIKQFFVQDEATHTERSHPLAFESDPDTYASFYSNEVKVIVYKIIQSR